MIFCIPSPVRECFTNFWVESYQSDICCFRAMTLSDLHLVANWPVSPFIFVVLLLRYTFKSLFSIVERFLNFEEALSSESSWALSCQILAAVRHLGFVMRVFELTTHELHSVVLSVVQNLVEIGCVVLKICGLQCYSSLASKCLFLPLLGVKFGTFCSFINEGMNNPELASNESKQHFQSTCI